MTWRQIVAYLIGVAFMGVVGWLVTDDPVIFLLGGFLGSTIGVIIGSELEKAKQPEARK